MKFLKIILLISLLPSIALSQVWVDDITSPVMNLTPASLPGTCAQGEMRFDISDAMLKVCIATNTWASSASTAPLSVGTFDSQAADAKGLVITAGTLYAQSADATHPGMVNTGSQTFAGAKTFSGGVIGNVTGNVTGNADTATALAANPSDCSAGQKATAIAANGNLTCSAVSLTADVSGTLPVANGGTGATSLTANALLLGNGTSAFQVVTPQSTQGYALQTDGSGLPIFDTTLTLGKSSAATGQLDLAGSTSGIVSIKPQNAAGTYNFNLPTTAGSSGQVLASGGGGSSPMTWTSPLTNPMTTTGDIIYSSDNSGTAARLAVGATNTFLSVSSGIPAWRTQASGVVSKTTTYTATTADDVIAASTLGGAWTLSLYTASGNTGRVLRIVKTSADFSVLTIDPNSTETIRGQSTFTLNTQNESVTIVSDGSNWIVVDHQIPSKPTTYTPALVSSGGGSITLNSTGKVDANAYYRRVGGSLEISFGFRNGTGGAASGTAGSVLIGIPSGLSIGSTIASNGLTSGNFNAVGIYTGSAFQTTYAYFATSSSIAFLNVNSSGTIAVADLVAGYGISGTVTVPISGWEP